MIRKAVAAFPEKLSLDHKAGVQSIRPEAMALRRRGGGERKPHPSIPHAGHERVRAAT
jgi:hypothetical protein